MQYVEGVVESQEFGSRAPRFSKFIMVVSFSDTLLMVSILDMTAICGSFCSPEVFKCKLSGK